MKKLTPLFLYLGLMIVPLMAEPFELNLYPGPPPGAELSSEPEVIILPKREDDIMMLTHVQTPTVRIYQPAAEKNAGVACVIVPGGAYHILAIDHEGYQVAQRLGDMGITAVVLKYRVSDKVKYQHPVPVLDVRQSIRLVRQHASKWLVDPQKIGILGFSAGGHLASCALTLSEEKFPGEESLTSSGVSHRPDFGALIYPVISLSEGYTHSGSRTNLLGPEPDPEMLKKLSTDLQVTAKTPPTILFATQEDQAVPAMNSISFYLALQKHGVPGELHVWEKGRHGFGMLSNWGEIASAWPERFEKWLIGRGLLTVKK